jgi:hypothetical protein
VHLDGGDAQPMRGQLEPGTVEGGFHGCAR